MPIQNLFHKETKMSTTKVTTQKVIAVLKKAGLEVVRKSSRFGSGYDVSGYYEDFPMIEIDFNGRDALHPGSYTANKIEKLTSAASVLLEAGLTVLMSGKIPGGKFDSDKSSRYDEYKIYVRKDGAPQTNAQYAHWDVEEITQYFAEQVAKELADEAADQAAKDAKRLAAEQAQAERLARVDLLNPMIGIDHNYLEGLFVTHVTLLDGRLAVLTVAYKPIQDWDVDATIEAKAVQYYNCFDVELTYIAPDKYKPAERWEQGTSNLRTGKGETVNSAIRYWISRQ